MVKHQEVSKYYENDCRTLRHTHNFFVDDLKLYSQDLNSTKKQLDIITRQKCAVWRRQVCLFASRKRRGNAKSQTDFHKRLNHQTNRRGTQL